MLNYVYLITLLTQEEEQLILSPTECRIFGTFDPFCTFHPSLLESVEQRKQLIITDDKISFTYCFHPMQLLQPYFKNDGIRNFMHTKHNGDKAKLRIFSFIPQRQRLQPNFMNHTFQTTNQTNKTRTTKTTTSTWVPPLTQDLCSYNRYNANSRIFIFKLRNKSTNFVHFIHHQFVHFIDPQKPVQGLMNNFVHSIHSYMNPSPSYTI